MPGIELRRKIKIELAVGMIVTSSLSCRPVITIGWWELLLLGLFTAVLLGPVLVRMIRRGKKEDKKDSE